MPSPPWTNAEQKEFLQSRMGDYLDAQKTGNYTVFWASLFEDWAREYPEGEVLFPGRDKSDYSPEETDKLKVAIQARRQQLQSWYRWRATSRARTAGAQPKVLNEMFGRSRLPHKSEIYSKLCYDDKIKPVVKDEMKKLNVQGRGGTLRLTNEVTRRMWEAEEDEDIKAQVEARLAELVTKNTKGLEPEQRTNEQYMEAISDCPRFLGQFLNALAEKTGWAFSVLMGGPDPSTDGDITVASFHAGETSTGKQFGQAHPNFEKVYMEPYTEFLLHMYPPDVRRSRSLNATPQETDAKVVVDQETGKRDNELELVTESDMRELQLTSDALSRASGSAPGDASTVPADAPEPVTTPPSDTFETVTTLPSDQSATIHAQSEPATLATTLPIGPAPASESAPSDPIAQPSDITDMSFLDGNYDLSGLLASLHGDAEHVAVGPDNFLWTPNYSADFSWMQELNFPAFDASNVPVSFPPTLPGPSDLSVNTAFPNISLPDFITPALPQLPHDVVPSLPNTTAPLDSPVSITENQLHSTPVIANTPSTSAQAPQPVLSTLTALQSLADANHDASDSAQSRSRSGRPIIPSTRADKMNEIGSLQKTSLDSSNKENIPPGAENERPAWALAAEAHLTTRDLGDGWTKCVEVWVKFEDAMGPQAKGALPSAKSRPAEWTKWVAKSRHGVRAYGATPTIQDPLDFGYAVMSWWKSMQPMFRQCAELLPNPVYDAPAPDVSNVDEWAALRKGGPNGMVSVMTVLVWWGQSMKSGSQWQESSEPHWRACVDDVRQCLEKMMPVSRKRAAREAVSGPSKRSKKNK